MLAVVSLAASHRTGSELAGVGGRVRIGAEYQALFQGADFEFVHDWDTGSPMHVLEGRRP